MGSPVSARGRAWASSGRRGAGTATTGRTGSLRGRPRKAASSPGRARRATDTTNRMRFPGPQTCQVRAAAMGDRTTPVETWTARLWTRAQSLQRGPQGAMDSRRSAVRLPDSERVPEPSRGPSGSFRAPFLTLSQWTVGECRNTEPGHAAYDSPLAGARAGGAPHLHPGPSQWGIVGSVTWLRIPAFTGCPRRRRGRVPISSRTGLPSSVPPQCH